MATTTTKTTKWNWADFVTREQSAVAKDYLCEAWEAYRVPQRKCRELYAPRHASTGETHAIRVFVRCLPSAESREHLRAHMQRAYIELMMDVAGTSHTSDPESALEKLYKSGMSDAAETLRWFSVSQVFESTDMPAEEIEQIDQVVFGANAYPMRATVSARANAHSSHAWTYSVDDFSPRFVGKGETFALARRDWQEQVHRRFQQLVRKRPFRMSEDEKADWAVLSELIDVEHYRKTTPIKQQETGRISTLQSGVCEITWLGSDAVETVNLENASPEFAAFAVGQWFEALVERNREDYSLSKVIHAQAIEPIKEMTDNEWKDWLSSLPTTESLPKSDTDWSTF